MKTTIKVLFGVCAIAFVTGCAERNNGYYSSGGYTTSSWSDFSSAYNSHSNKGGRGNNGYHSTASAPNNGYRSTASSASSPTGNGYASSANQNHIAANATIADPGPASGFSSSTKSVAPAAPASQQAVTADTDNGGYGSSSQ